MNLKTLGEIGKRIDRMTPEARASLFRDAEAGDFADENVALEDAKLRLQIVGRLRFLSAPEFNLFVDSLGLRVSEEAAAQSEGGAS